MRCPDSKANLDGSRLATGSDYGRRYLRGGFEFSQASLNCREKKRNQ
jgi:hypothetical protein